MRRERGNDKRRRGRRSEEGEARGEWSEEGVRRERRNDGRRTGRESKERVRTVIEEGKGKWQEENGERGVRGGKGT